MLDVLVIGAGPTGLLMAAESVRYGMSCRIIDRSRVPAKQSRALAIQPRTLEIFAHLGIIDPFLAKGIKIHGGNPCSGKKRLAHFSFAALDSPYPFILSLEQSETEKILTEYLSSFAVPIEREVEFLDLVEEEDRVSATLRHLQSGKEEKVQAAWAVGCDGAHSQVRKCLGFSFSGKAFPAVLSLADVEIDWKYRNDEVYLFFNPDGILGFIPMPGKNRYRLVFQLERCLGLQGMGHGQIGSEKIPDPTLEEVRDKVRRSIGEEISVSHPTWTANFQINSRLVESYQKGRVFLAGDAAHIHSPAGGQGMNSGLQDVFNLAWKLSTGDGDILQTYTLERRSWGESLIRTTRLVTWLATLRNPLGIFLRNLWIRMVVPLVEKKITRAVAQISIQYPKSCIVSESGTFHGGPKVGTRAPNGPMGSQGDLYTVLRKTSLPHLLLFEGAEVPPLCGIISLHVTDKRMKPIYGIKGPSAYLIRPDHVIGHRSSPPNHSLIQSFSF